MAIQTRRLPYYDSTECLFSCEQISCRWVRRFLSNEDKEGYPHQEIVILPLLARLTCERLQINADFLLMTSFPSVPTSMILNDLEIEKCRVFSAFFAISGCNAHIKNEFSPKLLEIDQANLRLMSFSSHFFFYYVCRQRGEGEITPRHA